MSGRDYKPLSNACVKNLCDKLFEKRKVGAMEVEQLVKSYASKEKRSEIEKMLQIFGQDFAVSPNVNTRKGGLFGLASVAMGLRQASLMYSEQLIGPIFQALRDIDSQVRYTACESLYNILKVLQAHSLEYLNDLFEAFCTATADPDTSVRQAVDNCDHLLRDIVIQNPSIDVSGFISIVCDRIRTLNPCARKFVVGWISTLNSLYGLNIVQYISLLLDGLLTTLGDENWDIRRNCDILLADFLSDIIKNPDTVDILLMVDILISHCQESTRVISSIGPKDKAEVTSSNSCNPILSPERLQQITCLKWMREFIFISTSKGLHLLPFVAPMLSAVLPCLDDRECMYESTALKRAVGINEELAKFVYNLRSAGKLSDDLDCSVFLRVVHAAFDHPAVLTRLAALRWVEVLLSVNPGAVLSNSDQLMNSLLKLLSDPAVEVVHSALSLAGCLFNHPSAQGTLPDDRASIQRLFTGLINKGSVMLPVSSPVDNSADHERANILSFRFLYDLVQRFINIPQMLNRKGSMIITDLCLALGARSVYYVMAMIVSNTLKPSDAFAIVQALNLILLTQAPVNGFREYLHTIDLTKDAELFEELYRAWCHNPVALVALCLLTQNYTHCSRLVRSFGSLFVTIEILKELDILIQLLESPVFATLRLHLVDKRYSTALQETLYCLLMCIPQTEAFHTLRRRLQCIPGHFINYPESSPAQSGNVNFDALLGYFHEVQRLHHESRVKELTGDRTKSKITTAKTTSPTFTNSDSSGTTAAPLPIRMEFLQLEELNNPLMSNSTQFFIKGLQQFGIETLPPQE